MIKGDQEIVRKCYKNSLKLKKRSLVDESVKDDKVRVNLVDINPREDLVEDSLTPIEDVKTLQIGAQSLQTTQIDSNLSVEEEDQITRFLRQNMDLFAWKSLDMPEIDPSVVCHHLSLDPAIKPIAQRKRNEFEEKRRPVKDEVRKLIKVDLIK